MGARGAEVARQAADLVLADDELRTVVTPVAEGRRIYANIRTYLRYALAGGFAEVVTMLGAPLVGLAISISRRVKSARTAALPTPGPHS